MAVQDIKGVEYQDSLCDTFILPVIERFKQRKNSFRA